MTSGLLPSVDPDRGTGAESPLASQAVRLVAVIEAAGNGAARYCMPGKFAKMNGYYSVGHRGGIVHCHPEFRAGILAEKEALLCR